MPFSLNLFLLLVLIYPIYTVFCSLNCKLTVAFPPLWTDLFRCVVGYRITMKAKERCRVIKLLTMCPCLLHMRQYKESSQSSAPSASLPKAISGFVPTSPENTYLGWRLQDFYPPPPRSKCSGIMYLVVSSDWLLGFFFLSWKLFFCILSLSTEKIMLLWGEKYRSPLNVFC